MGQVREPDTAIVVSDKPKNDHVPEQMRRKDFKEWLEFFGDPEPKVVRRGYSEKYFEGITLRGGTYGSWVSKGKIAQRPDVIKVITILLSYALTQDHPAINKGNVREYAEAFVASPANGDEDKKPLTSMERKKVMDYIEPIIKAREDIAAKSIIEKKGTWSRAAGVVGGVGGAVSRIDSRGTRVIGAVVVVLLIVSGASVLLLSRSPYRKVEHNRDWLPVHQTISDLPMVQVPAGCFNMGNAYGTGEDERKVSRVCFEKPFWIGQTEITQGQYKGTPDKVCNTDHISKNSLVNSEDSAYAMNCVTWSEANNFCQDHLMRLPTEAEWEYAARGPDNWLYPWGDLADTTKAILRVDQSAPGKMLPAGSKPDDKSWVDANDMLGSLREFSSTLYDPEKFPYPYRSGDGRESLENVGNYQNKTSTLRVVRGKSFDDPVGQASLTFRDNEWYDFRFNIYGFRCVKD